VPPAAAAEKLRRAFSIKDETESLILNFPRQDFCTLKILASQADLD
jgi:hypothetical protein